jgi:hypothetical protein
MSPHMRKLAAMWFLDHQLMRDRMGGQGLA